MRGGNNQGQVFEAHDQGGNRWHMRAALFTLRLFLARRTPSLASRAGQVKTDDGRAIYRLRYCISGIDEGRKQVRAAAPALLGESSEKACRSLAGGPTLRLSQRSYNQMKCLAPSREAASRLRGVCCCFADLFGRYCTQYMVGMKHMPILTCKSLFFSARFLLRLG